MMSNENKHTISCSQFEELLSEYLEKSLDAATNSAAGEHVLSCPLCHALLNDVKESVEACRGVSAPSPSMTRLEARVLSMTMPKTAMSCLEFEEYLTDYMDGFLPAALFHRWERHAVLCSGCTDLPGMVVRAIAACYTYKMDELAVPSGLHDRILKATIGTIRAEAMRPKWTANVAEWVRGLRFPIPVPQLAPVAMILLFAFMLFSQSVSADGSFTNIYQKGFELAEQTYQQSANAWNGQPVSQSPDQEPVTGTTFVDQEEKK